MNLTRVSPVPIFALFLLFCREDSGNQSALNYPETRKVDHVDVYHGVEIPDPYRWLENDTSRETEDWVKRQNDLTFSYLQQIPFRDTIRKRLDAFQNYSRMSAPMRIGDYYFYYKNSGLQNQSVIYRTAGLEGKEEVFIDPNTYNEDGTTAIRLNGHSIDDRHVVISISNAGSDWRDLVVLDVETGQSIGDTLHWVKFSGTSWDSTGFYYSRYPEPGAGQTYSGSNAFHSVYYHNLGDPQKEDILIYQDEDHPGRYHWTSTTEDNEYLILYIAEGTDGFESYFRPLYSRTESFTPLFTGFEHKNSVVDHIDGSFLVRTDIEAPKYRLVSVDIKNPGIENWKDIIPEKENLLESVGTAGGYLFAQYLEKACTQVYQFDYKGALVRKIELPVKGSAVGFSARKEDSLIHYSFTSFVHPGSIYRFNINTGKSTLYFQPEVSFDPEDYVSKQDYYESKDGTEISIFIVHHKDVKLDGSNPCLLYGYGGFNISLTPGFKTSRIPWLENGGVFAMPNLRGGGEYGESWHKAGMLLNKQTVFDDFIAAAKYLINTGYTSSEKLVISGRSNGGLLVGATMTQEPGLMKVALPGVGVMDMLRYHKFTVGHGWIPEYGSSEYLENFKNLLAYSPLHNIHKGIKYPATLIYTGDHDDRVVPAHSFKFAAALQEAQVGKNPVLIRIETQAGHGGGKPISKLLDEEADKLAFSFYNIGVLPYKEN